jgi:CHASE2 domain-containing sensor protein
VGPAHIASRRRYVALLLAAIAVGSAGLGIVAFAIHLFEPYELATIDTRFSIRGTDRPSGIVVVGIDDQTLSQIPGNPPYPRIYDADVIYNLWKAGARAIAYDLQFTAISNSANDDEALAMAVKLAHREAVLATTGVGANGSTDIFQGGLPKTGARAGYTQIPLDSDFVFRNFPSSGEQGVPGHCCLDSFAVAAAEVATHRTVPASDFPGGVAPVDFAGPPRTFPEVPFVTVLNHGHPLPASLARRFRNKIVVVGSYDPVLQDVHATAVGFMSGPEIWANAIWSVLHGNPLRNAPGALDVVLIALLGLAIPLARLRLRLVFAIDLAVGLGAAYLGLTQLAFDAGTILPVTYPLFALVLGTVSSNAADAVFERRQRLAVEAELARLPGPSATFFVSYRRDQSSWPAGILTDALTERFGEGSVFTDVDSIHAGETWPRRIEEAIRECDVVLVLIGPYWLQARAQDGARRLDDPGDWVRREIETGLDASRIVVPVLLDGARMPEPEDLPGSLARLAERNAIALSAANWNRELDALLASIEEGRVREFLAHEQHAGEEGQAPPRPPA